MLIGEAPGAEEDRLGDPFVGQAGKLLDNMLAAIGLNRSDNVYIANVLKCRPPGNRNPEPGEVEKCTPFLKQQIALIKPKLIIAMGRFAAQTLLASDATIASMRGRVFRYEGELVLRVLLGAQTSAGLAGMPGDETLPVHRQHALDRLLRFERIEVDHAAAGDRAHREEVDHEDDLLLRQPHDDRAVGVVEAD